MELVTRAAFAKAYGFSPVYAGKIENQLSLVDVEGKKKPQIDIHGVATLRFLEKREQNKKFNEPKALLEIIDPPITKIISPSDDLGARIEKKQLLELAKLEKGNLTLDIKNDKNRGHLIPKILIKRVFARLYSVHENQLKALGVSASPKISDIYNESNQDKTKQILELMEKPEDKIMAGEINKILNSGEEERILKTTGILEDSIIVIIRSIKREFDKFLKKVKELGE